MLSQAAAVARDHSTLACSHANAAERAANAAYDRAGRVERMPYVVAGAAMEAAAEAKATAHQTDGAIDRSEQDTTPAMLAAVGAAGSHARRAAVAARWAARAARHAADLEEKADDAPADLLAVAASTLRKAAAQADEAARLADASAEWAERIERTA